MEAMKKAALSIYIQWIKRLTRARQQKIRIFSDVSRLARLVYETHWLKRVDPRGLRVATVPAISELQIPAMVLGPRIALPDWLGGNPFQVIRPVPI